MPMYEYKCGQCGKVFEVIQRFSDEPLTTHEGCGGSVQRLISAPALQFKGSGFYITDYARGSAPGPAAQKNAGSSTSESKSDSKSDSKSESKSDSKSESKSDSKPASSSSSNSSSSTTSSDSKK